MKETEFLSGGFFLKLPTKNNPRVILSINNSHESRQSFRLYNPFSKKAKFLKFVMFHFCTNYNFLAKQILPVVYFNKSRFIKFLENKLKIAPITSSIYIGSNDEKIVLQLQSENNTIGYLKYPLNNIGLNNICNEIRASKILSKKKLSSIFLTTGKYKQQKFIIVKSIVGQINNEPLNVKKILNKYKKPQKFLLINHPRIELLKKKLKFLNLNHFIILLENICQLSKNMYHEVFEHGDFAPWNIIRNSNENIPFDFEYFEENGLEYLDEIKYYFQIEYLLNKSGGKRLINLVSKKVNIKEFNLIFQIFLVKEIVNKIENKQETINEKRLLEIINNE